MKVKYSKIEKFVDAFIAKWGLPIRKTNDKKVIAYYNWNKFTCDAVWTNKDFYLILARNSARTLILFVWVGFDDEVPMWAHLCYEGKMELLSLVYILMRIAFSDCLTVRVSMLEGKIQVSPDNSRYEAVFERGKFRHDVLLSLHDIALEGRANKVYDVM